MRYCKSIRYMELKFTVDARKDLDWWKKNGSDAEKRKIKQLPTELEEHPRTGTGKPEQLTGCYSGIWSRRINKKDRLIYKIEDKIVVVYVLSMRGHYSDK